MRASSRACLLKVHSFSGTFFGREKLSFLFPEAGTRLGNVDGVELLPLTERVSNGVQQLGNLVVVVSASKVLHGFRQLIKRVGAPTPWSRDKNSVVAFSKRLGVDTYHEWKLHAVFLESRKFKCTQIFVSSMRVQ